MKPFLLVSFQSIRIAALLCISALALYGCSGSSDSGAGNVQSIGESAIETTNDNNAPDSNFETDIDTVNSTSEIELGNDPTSTPEIPTQVIPDPMLPTTTRITFEITVPAYSSNELLVGLVWGDIQASAAWVAGELWTLSEVFPIDTENELVVTFYDNNGDVILASYESTLRTGFNSVDGIQINADQFDSERWDTDGDGVSNLDESILGSDPVQLELRETYSDRPQFPDQFGTRTYEIQVPDERPYFEFLETELTMSERNPNQPLGEDKTLTIDINETGTGTLTLDVTSYRIPFSPESRNMDATRTNTGNSIIWTGESGRRDFNSGVVFEDILSLELKRIDADTRSADGTFIDSAFNTGPSTRVQSKFALIGEPLVESPECEPITGEVTQVFSSACCVDKINIVSKGVDDQYWTVVETTFGFREYPATDTDDESIFDLPADIGITNTYLTRSLGITFYCDYPELR